MPRLHSISLCRAVEISTVCDQERGTVCADMLTPSSVDYAVYGPDKEPGKERTILDGEKERQGDYVFTATEVGEYRFCFDNSISTFSDKLVDFEISVRTVLVLGYCRLGRWILIGEPGRKRIASRPPYQGWCQPRADERR